MLAPQLLFPSGWNSIPFARNSTGSQATVTAVAGMGYQGVEFYAPYFDWTESQTKEMRKLLDDLGIRCFSTHNDSSFFNRENLPRRATSIDSGTASMW